MTQPTRVASVLAALGLGTITTASILTASVSASPAPYVEALEPPTFNLSRQHARTLWDGEQSATRACMRERGLDYTPAPFPDADDLDAGYAELRGRDLEALVRDGYGVARSVASPVSEPDVSTPAAPLSSDDSARFVEALIGPEPPAVDAERPAPGWEAGGDSTLWYSDSCWARAHREIYGAAYPHDELGLGLEALQGELREALSRDPAYLWALSDWSGCMRERGHLADRPLSLARGLRDAHDRLAHERHELETRERALAADDARCDASVSLGARTDAARERVDAALRARHPELPRLERELDLALARARDVTTPRAALSSGDEERGAPRG
jgi:hypothetical protein